MASDWVKWDGLGQPVADNVMIRVRLATDKSPNEGLYNRPIAAGRYPWTMASGITHYMIWEGDDGQ